MNDKEVGRIYWFISVVTLFLLGFCYLNLLIGVSNTAKYNNNYPNNYTKVVPKKVVVVDATARDNSYVPRLDVQNFVSTLKAK